MKYKILRSGLTNIFLTKIWGPIVCIGSAVGVFGPDFRSPGIWLACPFFVVALFGFSVAMVEVRDGVVRHRRLFKWKIIQPAEIVDARGEWPPVLASVRLNRFVFPWGRLYFALDGHVVDLFRRGESHLLSYIREIKSQAEELKKYTVKVFWSQVVGMRPVEFWQPHHAEPV